MYFKYNNVTKHHYNQFTLDIPASKIHYVWYVAITGKQQNTAYIFWFITETPAIAWGVFSKALERTHNNEPHRLQNTSTIDS